jgi:hypothetical protein
VALDYLNLSGEKYKWFNLVTLDYLNLSGEKYKWFNLVALDYFKTSVVRSTNGLI